MRDALTGNFRGIQFFPIISQFLLFYFKVLNIPQADFESFSGSKDREGKVLGEYLAAALRLAVPSTRRAGHATRRATRRARPSVRATYDVVVTIQVISSANLIVSAYASIRQHTSAEASIRRHTSACVSSGNLIA
jgi:hypothetical protein